MEQNSNKGMYWLAAIVITGLIVFLIFNNIATNSDLIAAENTVTSLEQAKRQSDSLYQTYKSQLDIYKSENEHLYQQITGKEEELKVEYDKINRMISQAKRDEGMKKELEARLKELTEELERFRQLFKEQSIQIETLRKENAKLAQDKSQLADSLNQQKDVNAAITDQNQTLADQNSDLTQKVELASVLKVARVEAQAVKATNKGDDKGINYAKRTEKLKICFDVVQNEVAPQAQDAFFVRIIDPVGAPIIVESKGSGKMREAKGGKEIYFTMSKSFTYSTSMQFVCMEWDVLGSATTLIAGTYNFEVYNKGYLVGNTTLVLK